MFCTRCGAPGGDPANRFCPGCGSSLAVSKKMGGENPPRTALSDYDPSAVPSGHNAPEWNPAPVQPASPVQPEAQSNAQIRDEECAETTYQSQDEAARLFYNPPPEPSARISNVQKWVLAITVMVVAAGIAVALVVTNIDNGSTSSLGSASSGTTDPGSAASQRINEPHMVCKLEVLGGIDAIIGNGDDSSAISGALLSAIGSATPIFQKSANGYAVFKGDEYRLGVAGARQGLGNIAEQQCSGGTDAVLNKEQLDSLIQLVPGDAKTLSRISYFG